MQHKLQSFNVKYMKFIKCIFTSQVHFVALCKLCLELDEIVS